MSERLGGDAVERQFDDVLDGFWAVDPPNLDLLQTNPQGWGFLPLLANRSLFKIISHPQRPITH